MTSKLRALTLCLSLTTGCAHLLREDNLREEGSRGGPSKGWLVQGTRLPDRGSGYAVLRDDRAGGQHWGTGRLVRLVEQVGSAMHRAHHPILTVGDLSQRGGGQVPRHASHRNGRDVDLLFYAIDATTGQPVSAPAFVRYNGLGASIGYPTALTFDTARNWDLVETLVRQESAGIVRIFCAAWIKRILMTHARAVGRPEWVIDRAEQLLTQPGDSAPHDDHFHVRIACTPSERARGCVTGGPLWPWLTKDWEKSEEVAPADDDAILDALEELPPGVMHGPPVPSSGSDLEERPPTFTRELDAALVCRLSDGAATMTPNACFSGAFCTLGRAEP